MKTIDFENLNQVQKGRLQGLLNDQIERNELLQPVRDYYKNDRKYVKYHIITNEIIVAEMENPFDTEEFAHYKSFYEAFINGKRVFETGTFSLDGAILLAIAAKNGEPNAYGYMGKMIGLKDL